jgi:acyl-coenzyme A thioesterase PaaI-like protein
MSRVIFQGKDAVRSSRENFLVKWWNRLQFFPAGDFLFSFVLGRIAPYSGSISAKVEALSPGRARVSMKDRRKVRNHLKSIHAIALINLGEIASGLAVLSTIPDTMRGILCEIEAEYLKKARGKLTAIAKFELPSEIDDHSPVKVTAELIDEAGEIVTRVHATWMLGYKI